MSADPIQRILDQEVAELSWYMFPRITESGDITEVRRAYPASWKTDPSLSKLQELNPLVELPALLLDPRLGESHFVMPPVIGNPLNLIDYLKAQRQFLLFQMTANKETVERYVMQVVKMVAQQTDLQTVLGFVDRLWRLRWVVGGYNWSRLRVAVLTDGDSEEYAKICADVDRQIAEATRIVGLERRFKQQAQSTDEWLHEAYCLLPDIYTWLAIIHHANEKHHSDELEKFDRILDEFQADINTTLLIAAGGFGEDGLVQSYLLKALDKCETVDEAITEIRGIYRGRSILPKVWFEGARDVLRQAALAGGTKQEIRQRLDPNGLKSLDSVDQRANFGRLLTEDRGESMSAFGRSFE
jgi:hypothetical protein